MILLEHEPKHMIQKVQFEGMTEGDCTMTWSSKQTSHFLICISNSKMKMTPEKIRDAMNAEDINEAEIASKKKKQLIVNQYDGDLRVFIQEETGFLNNELKFMFPRGGMKNGTPYTIQVFALEYDRDEEEFQLYRAKKDENEAYIPVKVSADIQYKKTGFLGSGGYVCILKVPKQANYQDGAIMYHVEGVSADFPLPAPCLGVELQIKVPDKDSVQIRIHEEYQKFYKKV